MSKKYFTIEENDKETWIVDNTSCHIDGEPFKYKQADKYKAKMLCEVLNHLKEDSFALQDIMNIVHNIKYGNWKLEDLVDYIYKEVSMDDLWSRYDDLSRMMSKGDDNNV